MDRCQSGLPMWLSGKESACQCKRLMRQGFDLWVGKVPWRKKWQPTPVFLPGKFHGHRSLTGYSPRVAESDMMKHTQCQGRGCLLQLFHGQVVGP